MTDQGDHVVLACQSPDCGMRYPCPADSLRRSACPLCEGEVAEADRYPVPPPHRPEPPEHRGCMVGVLDNIRSALNVGTMLRSADGAAFDHVYLGGLTAAADNPKVVKTSLGAESAVATTSWPDTTIGLGSLRLDGYEIWAIEFSARSEPLQSVRSRPSRLAVVVGNERAGVDPAILDQADRHVHLDMYGEKNTLNVGVAFGSVAYWLRTVPVAD